MTDKLATLLDCLEASRSPYHSTKAGCDLLDKSGFVQLSEDKAWSVEPGGKYYLCRGATSLVAWQVGEGSLMESGAQIVATHTDSPCLKPNQNPFQEEQGFALMDVLVYGSPALHTWLDRDLTLAGAFTTAGNKEPHLFSAPHDLLRISSLAVHLKDRQSRDALKLNPQEHYRCLVPRKNGEVPGHVKSLVADAASVSEDDITYVDAYLGDAAKPAILGDNFLSASRLDNLVSYFASVLELCAKDRPAKSWRMIASFDSEEIGSQTWNGGRSTLISSVLNRLLEQETDVPPSEAYARFANKSFVASIDAAHGKHPLFPNSLEPRNAPVLNGGVAVKVSAAGHYAMAPELLGQVVGALDANDLPYQYFSYRNDIGGGSSLGPLLSTSLGMKTIDFGVPLLSMHSIREMAGVDDIHTLMQMISKVVWAD